MLSGGYYYYCALIFWLPKHVVVNIHDWNAVFVTSTNLLEICSCS